MIPSIKNAVGGQNSAKNTNLDLLSDGPHPSNFSQVRPQRDFQSNGLHPKKVSQVAQDAQKDLPRIVAISSNRINHSRGKSVDSNQSDGDGYDSFIRIFQTFQSLTVSKKELSAHKTTFSKPKTYQSEGGAF